MVPRLRDLLILQPHWCMAFTTQQTMTHRPAHMKDVRLGRRGSEPGFRQEFGPLVSIFLNYYSFYSRIEERLKLDMNTET